MAHKSSIVKNKNDIRYTKCRFTIKANNKQKKNNKN